MRDHRVGQRVVAAVVGVAKPFVVKTQGVEQRRVEVRYPYHILDGPVAEFVRLAVQVTLLESAARQPE